MTYLQRSHNHELSELLMENINNKSVFQQLILNGANINFQNENGWAILFELIVERKNQELLHYLTKELLDINLRDAKGRNALFWAIHLENFEAVKILIDNGIELNIKKNDNLHVMQYAVYKNSVSLLEVLLRCGIDVNYKDNLDSTSVIYAILYRRFELVEFLIRNKANLEHKDILGNSALSLAKELEIKSVLS